MSRKDGAKNRRKSERFESEDTLDAASVAAYLEALASGLRDGKLVLGEDGASFEAAVSGDVELEVDARHRKKKSRIELTVTVRREKPEQVEDGSADDENKDEDKETAETAATIPDEMSF